ncbi:3'-5' exoribonuclease YhaM family protein [Desulfobacca acetoxidans]
MAHEFVVNLKEGIDIQQFFIVRQVEERLTRKGEPYLAMVLADKSGAIPCKVWSNVRQEFPGSFQTGDYVGVVGRVESYNGELQLNIKKIWTLEQILQVKKEAKDFDASLLHACTAYDRQQMWGELEDLVQEHLTGPLRDLVQRLMSDHAEAWQAAPAARHNHHAYFGGLLEHTWFVGRLAQQVAAFYPDINRELALAGAILHDIGKLKELAKPHSPEYTTVGQLLGHIVLGLEMIRQTATAIEFPDPELLLQLEHIIISHHGYQEFGSPTPPKTREALMVYFLDDLDAKLKMFEQHLKADTSERRFTAYHRLLQRELYKAIEEPGEHAEEQEMGDIN